MATKKKESVVKTEEVTETVQTESVEEKPSAVVESIYTVDDYAKAPQSLDASADIIRAAFSFNNLTEATLSKATMIVKEFKERKVI